METDLIKKLLKFNTSTLSDALDSFGVNGGLQGFVARSTNQDLCGRAFTVEYGMPNDEEKNIAKAADFIDDVTSNQVVILANHGREDCTIWGGILTAIAKIKNLPGTVIDGACRDVEEIQEKKYSLYSKAVYMKTGKGRAKKINQQVPVRIGDTEIVPGDYIRGDKNGILVIPQNLVQEVISRAEAITRTEKEIINAVKQGMRLDEARKIYKYHRPWEAVYDK